MIDKETRYVIEEQITHKNSQITIAKESLKTLKRACESSKKMRKEAANTVPANEEHEKQLHKLVETIDEIQDSLKLMIENNIQLIEEGKEAVKKLDKALKALQ